MTGVSGDAASAASASDTVVPTGAALTQQVAVVEVVDLDDHALVEHLADCARVAAWAASLELTAAAEFARRPARIETPADDPVAVRAAYAQPGHWVREFADEELAARLRISSQSAANQVRLGCALAGLPVTNDALRQGRIDVRRARVIVEETTDLDRVTARQLDAQLAGLAESAPPARLRAKVRTVVLAADAQTAEIRRTRARGDRRVVITPAADGMAELWAQLPHIDAMAMREVLRGAARASRTDAAPGDDRTMDQRMADALTAPFLRALGADRLLPLRGASAGAAAGSGALRSDADAVRLAGPRGRGVELQVTVAASTLLGLDDAPAQLRGYGPITARAARELTEDARMRRLLTDPVSGAVLDVGSTTYTPTPAIARHVIARSVRCTFPHCGRNAEDSDLDHTVPFPAGPTSVSNLGPRCRRHHRFKHSGAVHVEQDPDGTTRWRTPTGHQYEARPPSVGIPVDDPPTEQSCAPPDDPSGYHPIDQSDGELRGTQSSDAFAHGSRDPRSGNLLGDDPCGERPLGDDPCGDDSCGDDSCGEDPLGDLAARLAADRWYELADGVPPGTVPE